MGELNTFIRGYAGRLLPIGADQSPLECLDEWLRRKIHFLKLKQGKRSIGIISFAGSERSIHGWWRLSSTIQSNRAMAMRRLRNLGLEGFTGRLEQEKPAWQEAPYAITGTYGEVRGEKSSCST